MGSGKSICFASLPGVFDRLRQMMTANDHRHSIIGVVLPLIALMQDQVNVVSLPLITIV